MKDRIGVLLVQIGYREDPDEVLEQAEKMIEEGLAPHKECDVVCLPEIYYEGGKEKFLDMFSGIAKKHSVNIITGSMPVFHGEHVKLPRNTAFVIDRNGRVAGEYSKAHLFDAFDDKESERFEAGDSLGVFDLDFGKVGVAICYDVRFPEYVRTLALKDIDLLLIPAAFYRPRTDDWEILLRSSALTNIMYVCAANQFGKRCAGRSGVVDPNGQFIAKAPDEECTVYSLLDMGFERNMRKKNPVFSNRRPDLYDVGE